METTKTRFKLFKDILREKGKYSQGRVYLLWSIVAYYITLGLLTAFGISKSDINIENFKMIIDALEYAMTLFAGYVFGGKAIEIAKIFRGGKDNLPSYDEPTTMKNEFDEHSQDSNSTSYPSDADNV